MLELLFPNIDPTLSKIFSDILTVMNGVLAVFFIIASWKVFKKMGEKPWKSIIPIYNIYLLYKNTWNTSKFWIYISTMTIFDISFSASDIIAKKNPEHMLVDILLLVAIPFGIIAIIYKILSVLRIAESFGKGKVFGVLMIFFYDIFMLVLGFGKASYLGNSEMLELGESENLAEKEAVINDEN